ncbi:MAG: T9SS type A sorting domain-containing protein [Flavobacteriales bacterium]
MKRSIISFSFLTIMAAIIATWFIKDAQEQHYVPRTPKGAKADKNKQKISDAFEYLAELRKNVKTGEYNPHDIIEAHKAVKKFENQKVNTNELGFEWDFEGPANVGGRTRAILINEDNPDIMFAGGVTGGLYKSTNGGTKWKQLKNFNQNTAVASIAQLGNGNLYVGTGSLHESADGTGSSGAIGGGLYRSTDMGETWELVKDFKPDPTYSGSVQNDPWSVIDKLQADPNNDDGVWIAHQGGLDYYDESENALKPGKVTGFPNTDEDVVVSNNGNLVLASATDFELSCSGFEATGYISKNGGNFEKITASNFPSSNNGRIDFAISPSNPDVCYAVTVKCENGPGLKNVVRSLDGGETWTEIGKQSSSFSPCRGRQGRYDLAISVHPNDPNTLFLGCVNLFKYNGQWEQLNAFSTDPYSNPGISHVDIHEFAWTPNAQKLYIGTDGGVFRSTDGGRNNYPFNRIYRTTQFYNMDYSKDGIVIGGMQDNGTFLVDGNGPNPRDGKSVNGGDGFACDISFLDPSVMFASSQFGNIGRSADLGKDGFADFSGEEINFFGGFFHTRFRLYEDPNDTDSEDSITYSNDFVDSTLYPGDTISYKSQTLELEKSYVLQDTLQFGDTLKLQDKTQSLFVAWGRTPNQNNLDTSRGVGLYVTRDAMRLGQEPDWWKLPIYKPSDSTQSVNRNLLKAEFTNDGNILYVAVNSTWGDEEVYKVAGFDNLYTSGETSSKKNQKEADSILNVNKIYANTGGGNITSISPDPNDNDHLILTKGGYGGGAKVLETTDATSSNPTWSDIWNIDSDLKGIPVFDGIISKQDPNLILVGTDWGVFATNDGGTEWSIENGNGKMGKSPVFEIRQQTRNWDDGVFNPGYIYLGTFGRGIYSSSNVTDVVENSKEEEHSKESELSLYPNPVNNHGTIEFHSDKRNNVLINIYNIKGKLVKRLNNKTINKGHNRIEFNTSKLSTGTYILNLKGKSVKKVKKFVVSK